MKEITGQFKSLRQSERAFEVETGSGKGLRTAVNVTRGEIAEGFLPIKITARKVRDDGSTDALNGVPVEIPAKVVTIATSALAEGTTLMENVVASATLEAVERTAKHWVALQAWFRLPADDGTPGKGHQQQPGGDGPPSPTGGIR